MLSPSSLAMYVWTGAIEDAQPMSMARRDISVECKPTRVDALYHIHPFHQELAEPPKHQHTMRKLSRKRRPPSCEKNTSTGLSDPNQHTRPTNERSSFHQSPTGNDRQILRDEKCESANVCCAHSLATAPPTDTVTNNRIVRVHAAQCARNESNYSRQ